MTLKHATASPVDIKGDYGRQRSDASDRILKIVRRHRHAWKIGVGVTACMIKYFQWKWENIRPTLFLSRIVVEFNYFDKGFYHFCAYAHRYLGYWRIAEDNLDRDLPNLIRTVYGWGWASDRDRQQGVARPSGDWPDWEVQP